MGDQYANHARYESATLNMNLNVRKCTFFSFQMRLFNESWDSVGQLIYHDYGLESAVDNVIFAAPRQHGTTSRRKNRLPRLGWLRGLFPSSGALVALLLDYCSNTSRSGKSVQ